MIVIKELRNAEHLRFITEVCMLLKQHDPENMGITDLKEQITSNKRRL